MSIFHCVLDKTIFLHGKAAHKVVEKFMLSILDCKRYVNDEDNDPHDWMEDNSGNRTGQVVTLRCNSGYNRILGLTVREFCDIAAGNKVSMCIRRCSTKI